MSDDVAAGFWSYAHDDNDLDGGAILELARLIKEEYNLLSGEPLDLFVDRESIAWGEEWRDRVDSSLAQTTFFIPVITPRYFKRPECRREFLEFLTKAKSRGTEELLLPILYIETDELSVENTDEVVALVAKTQYADWHTYRLTEPSSREYRTAVNALARRLLGIAKKVAEAQLSHELSVDVDSDTTLGIVDVIEQIMQLIPDWLDAVEGEKINVVQMWATVDASNEQVARLRRNSAPQSAVLSSRIRMAREFLPLAERAQRESQIYLSRSIELDPLMSRLAEMINERPESFQLAKPITEAIEAAMIEIEKDDRIRGDPSVGRTLTDVFVDLRHLGRAFQKCHSVIRQGGELGREGNDIVRRWEASLTSPKLYQLTGAVEGARQGYRTTRTELGELVPPHVIDAVLRDCRTE
jgi:TIR domain